jgi:hypothetical protein
MGYSAQDEQFIHQLPRPLDQVHDPDGSWSDRCYFNAHSPDGTLLLATGYGNNPNGQRAHGYIKVAMADGRHWDLDAGRRVIDDRHELYAGPMRWTCVEPLQRWTLELGPNASGVEWELHYQSRAPMWELLPIEIHRGGRKIVDMYHMKQSGTYTGWVSIDGQRISVDGFGGGRDRTFGVRVANKVDFWLWFEANFEDRAIEAWVWESADGTVQYVDGGITYVDGSLSKRFVKFDHDVRFDGDRKRPAHADIVFSDEDGVQYRVTADAEHQHVNVHYGKPPSFAKQGGGLLHYAWNSNDAAQLTEMEAGAVSMDQLMRFELNGMGGHGIFELLMMGDRYTRYPNWGPMDTSFAQQ